MASQPLVPSDVSKFDTVAWTVEFCCGKSLFGRVRGSIATTPCTGVNAPLTPGADFFYRRNRLHCERPAETNIQLKALIAQFIVIALAATVIGLTCRLLVGPAAVALSCSTGIERRQLL
jgi:hypothetical protein